MLYWNILDYIVIIYYKCTLAYFFSFI